MNRLISSYAVGICQGTFLVMLINIRVLLQLTHVYLFTSLLGKYAYIKPSICSFIDVVIYFNCVTNKQNTLFLVCITRMFFLCVSANCIHRSIWCVLYIFNSVVSLCTFYMYMIHCNLANGQQAQKYYFAYHASVVNYDYLPQSDYKYL